MSMLTVKIRPNGVLLVNLFSVHHRCYSICTRNHIQRHEIWVYSSVSLSLDGNSSQTLRSKSNIKLTVTYQ